jgi:hypothetical protein
MALDSNSSLIAAAREDAAGFDADATRVRANDAGARPGSLYGPRTPKQLAEQRASIEAEKAEYERDGNAGGVAACEAELRRLASEPVAEPPPGDVEAAADRQAIPMASGYLTAGSPSPPPRQRTDAELAAYIASVQAERDNCAREGKAARVAECDAELAKAQAELSN